MRCAKEHMLLYAVTDRAWCGNGSLYEQVESALKGGATCVQLREKAPSDKETLLAEAIELAALCRSYGVPFIVNDHVDIAIKCRADGIHVGQEDLDVSKARSLVGNKMMIGVSVHSVEEARRAIINGADYLGVGAMFPSSTKREARVLPRESLHQICNAVEVPVVAIGGITKDNMHQLAGTGVDGVALISAIFAAADIEQECRELRVYAEQMVRFRVNEKGEAL